MKKEYAIVFEAAGFGGVVNMHPYSEARYATEQEAEKKIEHLLSGGGELATKRFYVIPCYSKA